MSKKRTIECKNVDEKIYNEYTELKKALGLSHGKMFEMIYNKAQNPFKSGLSTRQKIELCIQNLIAANVDQKITSYVLRKKTGSRLDAVKSVMELYKNEIAEYNKKFH